MKTRHQELETPSAQEARHMLAPALLSKVKEAHRSFPTGVTIVAAIGEGGPVGLAVNAFSSVSIEPPIVLVCVNSSSKSHSALRVAKHIGISILARDQLAVAMAFASSGGEKFKGVGWHGGLHGTPVIDDASASFEVEVEQHQEVGTHTIFLGRVIDVEVSAKPPLVYADGSFYDGARLFEVGTKVTHPARWQMEDWI